MSKRQEPEPTPINIFVYGTLRQGFGNHRLMHGAQFVGKGIVNNAYLMASGIPFMKKTDDQDEQVIGEVYSLYSENQLDIIDSLEGHPAAYRREEVDVQLNDGASIKAWAYFFPHRLEGVRKIQGGDYATYRRQYFI